MSIALIGLSWLALVLAPAPNGQDNTEGSVFKLQDSLLPGFRADIAFLPDERMLGFVEIPGGEFLMGSDPERDPLSFDLEWWGNGRASGRPNEPTFFMSRYEVTVAQYATFLSASKYPVTTSQAISAPPDHPVTWVAWTDAVAYAAWLDDEIRTSAREGLLAEPLATLLLTGWRVALPNEAQWEKAARGVDGRIYPWGDRFDPTLCAGMDAAAGHKGPWAVGSFPSDCSVFGVGDASGTCRTWCAWQPGEDEPAARAGLQVVRGGGWLANERSARCDRRTFATPIERRGTLGLRVAFDLF